MKALTVAAVPLAALTLPAQAQMGGMGGGRHGRGGGDAKADDKKPKIDEKAYKDALKRIPDSKEKYDPWSGARPSSDQKPTK